MSKQRNWLATLGHLAVAATMLVGAVATLSNYAHAFSERQKIARKIAMQQTDRRQVR